MVASSMRAWCALCGEDLEQGRRRCACSEARAVVSTDPPCVVARINRLHVALVHAGVCPESAVHRAVWCVREGLPC